jgi:hypothetical protein
MEMKPIAGAYKLYLDDVRTPSNPEDWEVVRSYRAFVEFIETYGIPYWVSFDHDLADEHYKPDSWSDPYVEYREKTGLDCAKWLVEYCRERGNRFPQWTCHSMNLVGKQRIIDTINDYIRETRDQ